jgi:hypothetical protein
MSFATTSKDAKSLEQSTGSKYINKSGLYPVTIIAAFVSASKNGAQSVDLFVNSLGQDQVVYGSLNVTNNDGKSNEIGAKIFNQLMVVAGVDDVADPVEMELPIGKKGVVKAASVLEDLQDIECFVEIQMTYHIWNGDIRESSVIRGFYRDDKASAAEIVNETEVGVQFGKQEAYAENDYLKEGLTPEQVAEWIKAKRPKGTANGGGGSASASSASASAAPAFGKKRAFGAKDTDAT